MYSKSVPFERVSSKGRRVFGAPIGILMLDDTAPFIPGSVGNASTFTAPVLHRKVPGLTGEDILSESPSDYAKAVVEVARELAADGVSMITANCGFMLRYQRAVQDAVDVPVLLSSLGLVPFLQGMLPTDRKLGVLTASSQSMTPRFLDSAGLQWDADRLVIAGLESAAAFNDAFVACVGTADIPAIEDEVLSASQRLITSDPTVGCLLLECSELPPYAAAVQRATGVPVFDFTSMIEFFTAGLRRTPFDGYF